MFPCSFYSEFHYQQLKMPLLAIYLHIDICENEHGQTVSVTFIVCIMQHTFFFNVNQIVEIKKEAWNGICYFPENIAKYFHSS